MSDVSHESECPYWDFSSLNKEMISIVLKKNFPLFHAEVSWLYSSMLKKTFPLFSRSPEGAKIKQKMVYTSSKDYLKRALVGIAKEIQANDRDDLLWSNVLEVCMRGEAAGHWGQNKTQQYRQYRWLWGEVENVE